MHKPGFTVKQRTQKLKHLEDHLVLELILHWTGKGNSDKAESEPEINISYT